MGRLSEHASRRIDVDEGLPHLQASIVGGQHLLERGPELVGSFLQQPIEFTNVAAATF
jgi:hypothetical protein